jgi:hypothetical protein
MLTIRSIVRCIYTGKVGEIIDIERETALVLWDDEIESVEVSLYGLKLA